MHDETGEIKVRKAIFFPSVILYTFISYLLIWGGLGFGVGVLGFGVWGFGVGGLGFGVWGLGLGV